MGKTTVSTTPLLPLDELLRSFLDRDPGALLAAFAAVPEAHPSRPAMRERVVEAWLPLAHHLARRYADRGEAVEDLRQVAALGLIKAVDRFDPAVGDFVAFAVPTITGEIKRHFRDHTWRLHVQRGVKDRVADVRQAADVLEQRLSRSPSAAEIADYLGITESDVVEVMCASQAYRPTSLEMPRDQIGDELCLSDMLGADEPGYDLAEHRPALAMALAALDARSREVVRLRFLGDLTQQQIAGRIGVSQMHVSRILSSALAHLRQALAVTG